MDREEQVLITPPRKSRSPRRRKSEALHVIHAIKLWAVEITALLIFLKWLAQSLNHELKLTDLLKHLRKPW